MNTCACPDCGKSVTKDALRSRFFPDFGWFAECPVCAVGSPISSWHAVPTKEMQARQSRAPHALTTRRATLSP